MKKLFLGILTLIAFCSTITIGMFGLVMFMEWEQVIMHHFGPVFYIHNHMDVVRYVFGAVAIFTFISVSILTTKLLLKS